MDEDDDGGKKEKEKKHGELKKREGGGRGKEKTTTHVSDLVEVGADVGERIHRCGWPGYSKTPRGGRVHCITWGLRLCCAL